MRPPPCDMELFEGPASFPSPGRTHYTMNHRGPAASKSGWVPKILFIESVTWPLFMTAFTMKTVDIQPVQCFITYTSWEVSMFKHSVQSTIIAYFDCSLVFYKETLFTYNNIEF